MRFVAEDYASALGMMQSVRSALIPGGAESGKIGDGAAAVNVTSAGEGSGCGYVHGTGLYFVKCSFDVSGRSDIFDC